jgi:uncharacterized protein (TIGR00255 family)
MGASEKDVRNMIAESLTRGSIEVYIEITSTAPDPENIINQAAATAAYDTLKDVAYKCGIHEDVTISDIIRVPGVFDTTTSAELSDNEKEVMLTALKQAIAQSVTMREEEGESLKSALNSHIDEIEEFMKFCTEHAPLVIERVRQRLKDRLAELEKSASIPVDESMLEREVMFFADRSDIAEEMDRLKSHIDQFRNTLKTGGEAGKQLEFIGQEILREVNTTASKGNDTEIAKRAIKAKLAVEKIKEQAANIE